MWLANSFGRELWSIIAASSQMQQVLAHLSLAICQAYATSSTRLYPKTAKSSSIAKAE
jgi:hypothetical protein